MAWHCTVDRWYQIHPTYRARMIAHFLHRSQREAFIADYFSPKEGGKKGDGGATYERLMAAMH